MIHAMALSVVASWVAGLWLACLSLGPPDMSIPVDLFDGFPQHIPAEASNAVDYEQKPGYFALHGTHLPTDKAVVVFEAEKIVILQGEPSAPLAPGQAISPVYSPRGGGSLAVPTGQLFIRFQAGQTVEAHRAELEQAGFTISQGLDYAPQAAWLSTRSGSIAEALRGVSRLRGIAGVAGIEPQLLMQRAHR